MGGLGLIGRRRAIASSPSQGLPFQKFDKLVVTSGAYIKTDYYVSNYDRIRFKAVSSHYPGFVFGARKGMGVALLYFNANFSYAMWQADNGVQVSITPSTDTWRIMGMKAITASKYRGVLEAEGSTGSITLNDYASPPTEVISQVPLLVCASLVLNSDIGVDTRYFQGEFYGLQVYDSRTDELKLDLVPAIYKGVTGLYDTIGNKFYENANTTGSFTAENE